MQNPCRGAKLLVLLEAHSSGERFISVYFLGLFLYFGWVFELEILEECKYSNIEQLLVVLERYRIQISAAN